VIVLFNPRSTTPGKQPLPLSVLSLAAVLERRHRWALVDANLTSDPGLTSTTWGSPDPTPGGDVAGNGEGCGGTSYIGAIDPTGDNWTAEAWINYVP